MSENKVDNYGWQHTNALPSSGYITPTVIEILQGLRAKRVLDLGAGNGVMCNILHESGFQSVGVEYDKQGYDLSRKAFPHLNFYNHGVQDNPSTMLASEGPFDAVTSTEVVEHLYSPHLLPQYAHKCLKKGGHLVISTPYHGYLKNLALAITGKWDDHHTPLWHGGHIKFWSRSTLTKLLNDSQFKVVGFHGVGRAPYLWKSMILVARKV